MCFVCSLAKQHTVFKWKDAISAFPVSQGSAEPIDSWVGKTKHRPISYFLCNTSAKNYLNWIMYVSKSKVGLFWDSVLMGGVSNDPAGFKVSFISAFPVSQGSAEPIDSWVGKTKHRPISYFLSNTSAKNYLNWIMYVIASQRWGIFWDSVLMGGVSNDPAGFKVSLSDSLLCSLVNKQQDSVMSCMRVCRKQALSRVKYYYY